MFLMSEVPLYADEAGGATKLSIEVVSPRAIAREKEGEMEREREDGREGGRGGDNKRAHKGRKHRQHRSVRVKSLSVCIKSLMGYPYNVTPPTPALSVPPEQVQGYLAHRKTPTPLRTTIGPWAYSYCRVPGGRYFL